MLKYCVHINIQILRIGLFFGAWFSIYHLTAQTSLESLFHRELSKSQLADTFKSLENKIWELQSQKTGNEIVLELVQHALDLAETYDIPDKKAWLLSQGGIIYLNRNEFAEALYYFTESIELWNSLNYPRQEMDVLGRRGYLYVLNTEFAKASEDYKDAIFIGEQMKDKQQYDSISLLEKYLSLVELYIQAEEEQVLSTDLETLTNGLENAESYIYQKTPEILIARNKEMNAKLLGKKRQYQKATVFFEEAISKYDSEKMIDRSWMTKLSLAAHLLYWGDELEKTNKKYLAKEKFLQAKRYYIDYLNYYLKINDQREVLSGYVNIGAANKRLGLFSPTIDTLKRALDLADTLNLKNQTVRSYRLLSETYEIHGLKDSALKMYKNYAEAKDSVATEKSKKAILFSEEIIETEKRRIEAVRETERQKQQRQTQLLIALIIVIIVASVGGYFYYRTRTQRRLMEQKSEINRQIVVDLIKEQAIENLNSRLEGQDQERERIARDLHDRLGGTLSATKMHLERLGRKITSELTESYQETYKLLNLATQETRQISHDMMALPLMHMGFEASVKELCKTINASGKIQVHFNAFHQANLTPSEKTKRHLYHVVQELLQNIIKHAKASQVFIQLHSEADSLRLMVEDNGKGFDTSTQSKGMGLSNIEDRIKQLDGTLDIDSMPGRGTTVMLEIPV